MPLHRCEHEDCIIYEYMRPTWRFGISLEQDPRESGWFFVSKGNCNPIIEGGRLNKVLHHILHRVDKIVRRING